MKISTCLIELCRVSNGIAIYEIEDYLSKLIKLGYLDINGTKYVVKEKNNAENI